MSRRQELEADAAAAAITSPAVTADALRAVHAIGACWELFQAEVVAPMRRSGRMPDDAFSAFGALLRDPESEPVLARLSEARASVPASPLDTHPSLAARLDLLASMPEVHVARSARPAESLVAARARLFQRASRGLGTAAAKPLPWRHWLELVAWARAAAPARMLRRAVSRMSASDRPPLAVLLDLLEAGQARELAAELSSPAPFPVPPRAAPAARADGEAMLLAGMFSLAGQALVAASAASWQLSLDGECRLVARDIPGEELAGLLAAAIARPAEVPRLRLHLAALGVNVAAPIALGDAEQALPAAARPAATAGSARLQQRQQLTRTLAGMAILIAVLAAIGLGSSSRHAVPPGITPQQPDLAIPPGYQDPVTPGIGALPIPQPGFTLPPPSAITVPLAYATIVVQPGETPTSIASGRDTTVPHLQAINQLSSSTAIYAGQRLKVDTLSSLVSGTCR